MKLTSFLLLLAHCCCSLLAAEKTANARLWCESVRFFQGSGPYGLYTLDMSSYDPSIAINGELTPVYGQYTHGSYFALTDPSGFEPMVGIINLNVPLSADANDNGFPDFFEVSESTSGSTTGTYSIPGVVSAGTVRASWSRGADSARGTCVLSLQSLGDFTHPFDIIEFKGAVSYRPGATNVSVALDLPRSGAPDDRLGGQLECVKSATNPHDHLLLQPGSCTNTAMETLTYTESQLDRDPTWPTNYYGYVEFDNDSDPATFYPYAVYGVSMDDLNDSDHDGIPDFSDDLLAPARPPQLTLTATATNLMFSVSGEVQRVYSIDQAVDWPPSQWATIRTVTLTNDTQMLVLPFPASPTAFWRVWTR